MIWYPSNGIRITAAENVTNDNKSGVNNDASIITYGHLGNPLWIGHIDIKHLIKKVSVAWENYGCILQSDIFHINRGSRIFIENTSSKQGEIYWDACSTDMDNHPDAHFFGRNIRPISFTSEECTVAHFLKDYSEQVNIQICTGETSYTMELGEVIKLIFVQGLWFGKSMEKIL